MNCGRYQIGDSVTITYAYTRVTPKDWPRPAGRIDARADRDWVHGLQTLGQLATFAARHHSLKMPLTS